MALQPRIWNQFAQRFMWLTSPTRTKSILLISLNSELIVTEMKSFISVKMIAERKLFSQIRLVYTIVSCLTRRLDLPQSTSSYSIEFCVWSHVLCSHSWFRRLAVLQSFCQCYFIITNVKFDFEDRKDPYIYHAHNPPLRIPHCQR